MKLLTILILYLLFFVGCSSSKIPEITSKLRTIPVAITKPDNPIMSAISYKDSMVIAYRSGKIVRIKTETGFENRQYQFRHKLDSLVTWNNQYMIFSNESGELYGFDMNNMRQFTIPSEANSSSVRLTSSHLITTSAEKITVIPILRFDKQTTIPLMEDEILRGAHICDHQLLILTTHRLLFVNARPGRIQAIDLKDKASSDFTWWAGSIYYGTMDNQLLRLDTAKNKVRWKYRLSSPLRSAPVFHSKVLTIIPEDNNIYTINTRGSLVQWHKLSGKPYFQPVKMAENICIITDGPPAYPTCTFYNPDTGSMVKEKFARRIVSQPQYAMNELYMVFEQSTEDEEKEAAGKEKTEKKPVEEEKELSSAELRKTLESSFKEPDMLTSLEKIGNRFDIELIADPEHVKLAGRSVNYKVIPVNFIKPYIEITIMNQAEKKVFSTFFAPGKATHFTWVPDEPGDYFIKAVINSENRNEITLKYPVKIFNAANIIKSYYRYIQNNSTRME